MHVELLYKPGCSSYIKALQILQTIIAEERLPISIDVVEQKNNAASPAIRINGDDFGELPLSIQGDFCRLYRTSNGMSALPGIEHLRDVISRKWKDITEYPLLRGSA